MGAREFWKSLKVNLYLQGGVVVLLGEVILQGSLSYLLGHERLGDGLGLEEPCLTAGHHLTCLHGCVKEPLETLKFILRIVSFFENQEIITFKSNHNVQKNIGKRWICLEFGVASLQSEELKFKQNSD